MALYGLSEEDYRPAEVAVWPDNMTTVEVYVAMRTQWRFSHYGATGLDYGVLPTVLRLVGVPKGEWIDVFEGIRAMEAVEIITLRNRSQQAELDDE
jgi:hypothetical protein